MSSRFTPGDERTREAAKAAVAARRLAALKRRLAREVERLNVPPGVVDDAFARFFREQMGPVLGDPVTFAAALGVLQELSWAPWWAFLKAVLALPLTEAELAVFRACTGRDTPPAGPPAESFVIVGRRGGKSRIAAFVATYLAVRRDYRALLADGERGVVPVIAADRAQARVVLRYIKALFEHPRLALLVARRLRDAVELRTGVTIEVHTASYRTTRGRTVVAALADELAFWRTDEGSAEPDAEILAALRPSMATVEGALLLAISTPYAQRGELFRAFERHYGRAESDVLVWRAASQAMNPTLRASVVARAYEDDPIAAAAEYGAEWRRDVEGFLDPESLRAVTAPDRRELEPRPGGAYVAFVDPSGGSQDSMTLAIAHREEGRAVLDCVRERRAPFSPDDVVREYAEVLAAYGLSRVTGDRYGGAWPAERFAVHGIRYEPAERSKSDLYQALLPLVNAGRVELLDVPRLLAQLAGLERRTARGTGRDSIDHAPGARDDVANAVAGALVTTAPARPELVILTGSGGDAEEPGRDALAMDVDALRRAGGAWLPGDPWPMAEPDAAPPSRFPPRPRPPQRPHDGVDEEVEGRDRDDDDDDRDAPRSGRGLVVL